MNKTYPQRRRTPSFSSSLLDAIYRSIDEQPNGVVELEDDDYPVLPPPIKKQSCNSASATTVGRSYVGSADVVEDDRQQQHVSNLKRAIMIESWMEKRTTTSRTSVHSSNNSSSFSDCTSSTRGGGGGSSFFSSSSEAESVKQDSRRNSSEKKQQKKSSASSISEGGGFTKTKLRALKIYGELKKVKQPISPGGRIASFLNSIFSSGSAKKAKMCSIGGIEDVSFERKSKSTCSSVTSFSRSCLSKSSTNHSRGKSCGSNGAKRSVRFYPVSVIVDEDSRPCGHKCIYEDDPGLLPKIGKSASSKGNNSYQTKNFTEFDFRGFQRYIEEDYSDDGDDEDDDDESCSSSDLFELDHLIGIGRYREELPVYETTNLKKNQAIASGFIL